MKKYFILCSLLLVFSTSAATASDTATMEQRTFTLINQHRVVIGEEPLEWNEQIAKISRKHSLRMAEGKVEFGHGGFSRRIEKAIKAIPQLRSAGENVAYTTVHPATAKHIVDGWLNSPGHRSNIENIDYNVTGIGIAKVGGFYYFTQFFVYR